MTQFQLYVSCAHLSWSIMFQSKNFILFRLVFVNPATPTLKGNNYFHLSCQSISGEILKKDWHRCSLIKQINIQIISKSTTTLWLNSWILNICEIPFVYTNISAICVFSIKMFLISKQIIFNFFV